MFMLFNKILIICCLLLLHTSLIAQTNKSCQSIVSTFENSLQPGDWDKINDNIYKLQNCKCEMAPIFYFIYRMRGLLPNSMAMEDISPVDFVLNQKLAMGEQVKILKKCKKITYHALIKAMAEQQFDIELSESAIELKKKIED